MNAERTGGFIRDLRKEKGLTQQQFADMINVSDKAVSRWETGRGFPDIGYLEDIAGALGVSVAEILRGERLTGEITKEDINEVSEASISAARTFVTKKRWMNLITGFIAGLVLLALVFVNLTGQIPIDVKDGDVKIEKLSDGSVVAVMSGNVAGYTADDSSEPESDVKMISVSCYDTLLNRIFGKEGKTAVILGKEEDIDYVYYYPSEGGDLLLWKNGSAGSPSFGVQTLPRLTYNYWIVLGAAASVAGMILFVILRKKRFAGTLLRVVMIPVCLTAGTVLTLAGRTGTVYSAPYYLSGILLLSILFYVLFTVIYLNYRSRKKAG